MTDLNHACPTDWSRAEIKVGDRLEVTGYWDRDAGVQTFTVTVREVYDQGLGVRLSPTTSAFLPFWGLHSVSEV